MAAPAAFVRRAMSDYLFQQQYQSYSPPFYNSNNSRRTVFLASDVVAPVPAGLLIDANSSSSIILICSSSHLQKIIKNL